MIGKLSIGVDIVSINRFSEKAKLNPKFLSKWFSPSELDYCFSKKNAPLHLSGRFAAKEAVIKALNQNNGSVIRMHEVEIIGDGKSSPVVKLNSEKFEDLEILVSISHNSENAIAFSIVNERGD